MAHLTNFLMATARLLFISLLLSSFVSLGFGDPGRNDDTISFTQPEYHGFVQEKSVAPVVESKVKMGMWLTNLTRGVRFSVVESSRRSQARTRVEGNFIFLDLETGSISKPQQVRVTAMSANEELQTYCTVHVDVIDINDFQPLFPPKPYAVSIGEDTLIGTTIAHVKATDSDRDSDNTRFYYSFPEFTNNFAIHPTTGAVTLTALVSHETQDVHSLEVQATDRKPALTGSAQPRKTTLTVTVLTVNAHAPIITVHELEPFDSGSIGVRGRSARQVYAILKIHDPDSGRHGQIRMPRITRSDVAGLFDIEPRAKPNEYQLIFTRDPPPYNGILNVTVEVSDRGDPPRSSSKIIHVKLYDKRSLIPTFSESPFHMIASEFSPVFTQVGFASATVLKSDKPQDIRYSIENGNEDDVFTINENTSLITTTKRLNRNLHSQYLLTVAAVNVNLIGGNARNTTRVIVTVEDANDHDPLFTDNDYKSDLSENAPIGTTVISVRAEDEDHGINGSVVYSLIDYGEVPFGIDSFNGTIFTTGLLDVDLMSRTRFKVRVRASDQGLPFSRKSECDVIINLINANDNPPIFNEVDCLVLVPVTTPRRAKILQLDAIDIDRRGRFSCSLLSGGRRLFAVDGETCSIRLVSGLKRSQIGSQLSLLVTASDGKYTTEPMTVNVTVTSSGELNKTCRNTGALSRFEERMNNRLLQLRSGEQSSVNINRTSQIPNKFIPNILDPTSLRRIQVAEDLAVGSILAEVRAVDRDKGFNQKLWYTITSGNEDSCFWINTQNGVIKLARQLDRERKAAHNLTVSVTDLAVPSSAATVRVGFRVTDVNDNAPVFDDNLYTFELPENVNIGYMIQSNIQATDSDEGLNARVRYSLSSSVAGDKFSIHPITGSINVTGRLDREVTSEYKLTVIATDGSPVRPLSSRATVIIRVSDVNDNVPRFYRPVYRVRISEDLPMYSVVFWLQAHDPDFGENGIVRYTLTDGVSNRNDRTPRFTVDPRSGAIRLTAKLNARTQRRYNITARARDVSLRFSTCFIEVEVLPVNKNLHAPYFEYRDIRIQVSEDAAIGTEISTVSAVDEDTADPEGDVGYSIVDGTGLGVFTIDKNTGTITSLRTLDRETEQYYWLTVVAEDRADVPLSDHMFVLVEVTDINDNAPYATQPIYFASVSEDSPLGSLVAHIHANDKDAGSGGDLTYSLLDNNEYFKINAKTGEIRTKKRKLDRESAIVKYLTFDVTITDAGTPPLSSTTKVVVNLTDVNDNPPRFMPDIDSKLSLPERNRTKNPIQIARVVAHDKDGGRNANIDYVLKDGNGRFTVNPKTGVISTSQSFHNELHSVIKVVAYDLGNPQRHSRVKKVDIQWGPQVPRSAFAPVFTGIGEVEPEMYYEHVDVEFEQDASQQSSLRIIRLMEAEDVDSDQLWFYIIEGNGDNMFHINMDGSLMVVGQPDAEKKHTYNLTIQVTDGYNSAFTHVPVRIGDVNDHRPVFDEEVFHATVAENSPRSTHVIQVTATDEDLTVRNRNLIYSIRDSVDPSSLAKFRITPAGFIYTTTQLDREAQREHVLTIEVDDQGVPGSLQAYCRVVITVEDTNEHPPRFTAPSYSAQVMSNAADAQVGPDDTVDKVVLRVRATDQDHGENARIIYSISAGNLDRLWHINPSTGEVTATRRLISEDGNPITQSSFTVQATDGGREPLTSTAEVTIEVRAHDDTPPQFETDHVTVEIAENIPKESFITMVTASAPSGVTYDITSGNIEGNFVINPHSGVISLAGSLDREQQSAYNLIVTSVNTEGRSSTASVVIHVIDVNDNRPKFAAPHYVGRVSEALGSSVSSSVTDDEDRPLVVRASDADVGDNARLTYKIVGATEAITHRFTLDADTGAVRTMPGAGLFDYESITQFQFQVQAFDLGSPRLSSENNALVVIHVTDANDSIPAFTKSHYRLGLLLPTCDGVVVSKDTRAVDIDGFYKRTRQLTYSISGGNDGSAFAIDPKSGVVSVADSSSLSEGDEFSLRLRVTDGKRSAAAVATISVAGMPEQPGLDFTRDIYRARIFENSTEVRSLVVVSITGSALDDNIRFTILNPTPGFSIGSTSGVVSTTGYPVDREESDVYKLLVEAVDVQSNMPNALRRGRAIVHVNVSDVNDNSPEFVGVPYYATVQVDARAGVLVKQVRAVDEDAGKNSLVRYRMEGMHSDLFEIDQREGVVTLRRTPSDVMGGGNAKFNVTVVASDMGSPPLSGRSILRVSLVNRATPVFTHPFYGGLSISEDAQAHKVVTSSLQASSPDQFEVFYTIEDGDPHQQFDIDFVGGTITSRGCLDRERDSRYRLRVRARDARDRAHADVEVEVNVDDVNDNTPFFSKPVYLSRLPETASVGSTVSQVEAIDLDAGANGRVRYTILEDGSSDGGYFLIDPETGVIWTARGLDSDQTPQLSFVVRANDAGVPVRYSDVTVTLKVDDVNDNPPIFEKSHYEYSVNVEAGPRHFVGRVFASDPDQSDRNKLIYSIRQPSSNAALNIDSVTGIVQLSNDVNLRAVGSAIHTNVSVTDGVFTSSAGFVLRITHDDTSPVPVTFDQDIYEFLVVENKDAGIKIGTVNAIGRGPLTYQLTTDTGLASMFRVDTSTGNLYTDATIDRESIQGQDRQTDEVVIEFDVTATDNKGYITRCVVRAVVHDVNDNSPRFTQDSYAGVVVPSQVALKDHVLKVTAHDADSGENGRVTYAWEEDVSNAKRFFQLDVDTGDLTVRERPHRLGNVDMFTFYIRASDHGSAGYESNVVGVSIYLASDPDTVPKFDHEDTEASVAEDAIVGSEVAVVHASCTNRARIIYALAEPYVMDDVEYDTSSGKLENTESNSTVVIPPFRIDAVTGRITTDRSLDREKTSSYVITALAFVETTPELVASTNITVTVSDVNDNTPQFTSSEYQCSVVENRPATSLIHVEAQDPDYGTFGEVSYRIASPNAELPFTIDNKTGVIISLTPLDREAHSSYTFTVEAADGGDMSATSHVTVHVIDVNDAPPTFNKAEYSVPILESAPVGYVTKFMQISDNDTLGGDRMRLYITEGDPYSQFEVTWETLTSDEHTVNAGLKVVKVLDREHMSAYYITVLASDGLHTSTSRVRVSVGDVNDNSPTCQQLWYRGSVREDASMHTFILRIISSDEDAGNYGTVSYSLTGEGANLFNLDPRTGELFTSVALDREVTSEFWLTATSTDGGGRTCVSEIHVTVDDVNDNRPSFEMSSLRASTRESTPINSLLHRVVARDSDLGENGTITFSLIDDFNGQFYIEPDTGVVVLKKPLDRETVPSYQIRIRARDRGSERRLSSTDVLTLQILDVNDNPPIFEREQYEERVREDASPGHVITSVQAKSLDTGANAKLRYSITHGNEHGKFRVDRDSGEVTLISSVDYESDQSYVLTISASDRSENPLTSECTMRVIIVDVNDNSPQFSTPSYQVVVAEDAEINRVVTTVSASDKDSGDAGNVSYSLSHAGSNLPFVIDPTSGNLIVAAPGLDYETHKTYRLVVIAADLGTPSRRTEATVDVTISDVNDNRPQFVVLAPGDGETDGILCSSDGVNCTVYVHESASDSVVFGVAKLNATDTDGEGNAGPFEIRILTGNSAGLFYLDEENRLKSRKPLKLDDIPSSARKSLRSQRLVHTLTVNAQDSGRPVSLSSQPPLTLNVVVLKESQYAPEMTPHHVQISITGDVFAGGLISQGLRATDRDMFDEDRLRFSLALPEDFENFVIHPISGAITAESALPVGTHNITVRVSDGSRFSFSTVPITVKQVTNEALQNSVSISFSGISGTEEYLSRFHSLFVDKLRHVLPEGYDQDRDFLMISLQSRDNLVQVLFGVRKPPSSKVARGFYLSKSLRNILEKSRSLIGDKLRVQVSSIEGFACAPENCEHGNCQQMPLLDAVEEPVSTTETSFLTPTFRREEECVCPPGTAGRFCESICSDANNPCSHGLSCTLDASEEEGYRCEKPGRADSVMGFSGRAFAQYTFDDNTRNSPFRVGMRIRTFQSNATLFYASGPRHVARLETVGGFLRYTFDCGSGPLSMVRDKEKVNNGRWHDVDIRPLSDGTSRFCAFKLTLNSKYSVTATVEGGDSRLDLTSITFGGFPGSGKSKRSLEHERNRRGATPRHAIRHGYRGCFQEVTVNQNPLPPPTSSSTGSGIELGRNSGVVDRCRNSLIDMGACGQSPCLNGGICMPLQDGSHTCECPSNFDGDRCEISDPCGALPCKNKGQCLTEGNGFRCHCSADFIGPLCETPSLCRALNPCQHGGTCVTDGQASPTCRCPLEWTGRQCEIDVDECRTPAARKRCGGADRCHNYVGGYACNCTSSMPDPKCSNVGRHTNDGRSNPAQPAAAGPPVAVIVVMSTVVLILIAGIVVGVVCWKKRKNQKNEKYQRGSRRSGDLQSAANFNPNNYHQRPPQIPQRPMDYQRSSRGSFMDPEDPEQRNPLIGLVRPQLPPVTPSMSASDNDSMRKPPPSWQDYDPNKFNESAASSVHHFPPPRKISCPSISDQQSYDWDVTDWKPGGSGVVSPAVASVAYGRHSRGGASDVPSSPESRRSINSTSTNRSRRSHRSDALPGYYSNGKRRREKQLLRMVDFKVNEQDRQKIHQMLSQIVNQGMTENVSLNRDSRSSSLRSSSSKYHSSVHRTQPLPPPPPDPTSSTSVPNSVDSYSNSYADNECEDEEPIENFPRESPPACVTSDDREFSSSSNRPSCSDSDSAPRSSESERLPPPPSDFELRVLREEDDDDKHITASKLPPATSNSYSSLLAPPYNLEMPTPATARSTRFHPDQYLVNHRQHTSDASEPSESAPGSNYSLDLPYADRHHGNHRQFPSMLSSFLPGANLPYEVPHRMSDETTPHLPVRHASERLDMSSLSEADEEDELIDDRQTRHKRRHHPSGRPPIDPKSRNPRRSKKLHSRGNNRRRNEPQSGQEMQLLNSSTDDGPGEMFFGTPEDETEIAYRVNTDV